ncbi:hypothetical protein V462_10470 [Pantoea ananatis 15320]|uniref:hypothetical protein n=1 Tax=Pantoea ananas TaxID=553 RepID=UPI00040F2118|nr:hypothetical protein [Pantoea ananatis]PKC36270.1 hypothetical protein V462_10470 [Pantoea ananatis 15320]
MSLPQFDPQKQIQGNYSINQASEMKGKTIASVRIGFQDVSSNVHQTEMMIIEFTDGTQLAISTGSNVGNVLSKIERGEAKKLKAGDFHVDLDLTWQR